MMMQYMWNDSVEMHVCCASKTMLSTTNGEFLKKLYLVRSKVLRLIQLISNEIEAIQFIITVFLR